MKHLQGLVSFIESASGGSFTAAAAKLDLTPAAVSKNVMRLEQQLQVRLFNRTTRRLTLTEEGQAFLGKASEALRLLDAAVTEVTRAGGEPAGRVRISVGLAFGRRFVLPLLGKLAQRYPRLQVEVSLDNRPVDLVGEGYDIGLRGGHLMDSGLVARRISPLSVVLVASPAYLRRHGVPQTPEDLAGHRLLGVRFGTGMVPPWVFRKPSGRGRLEMQPQAQLWVSDPESLLDLAEAGEGIAQAGLPYIAPLLRAGRLQLLLHGQHEVGDRSIFLCYPHRQFLSQRVRVVVDALLASFEKEPDLHLDAAALPAAWCATPPRQAG